ncbi:MULTISPECIES: hypothetical protein [unclassified Mesorhizobium]|uniref:hypothetical protein n=1 Tax=unclassified Mesorhizobium TaxID=325217 RepID=UPI0030149E27
MMKWLIGTACAAIIRSATAVTGTVAYNWKKESDRAAGIAEREAVAGCNGMIADGEGRKAGRDATGLESGALLSLRLRGCRDQFPWLAAQINAIGVD